MTLAIVAARGVAASVSLPMGLDSTSLFSSSLLSGEEDLVFYLSSLLLELNSPFSSGDARVFLQNVTLSFISFNLFFLSLSTSFPRDTFSLLTIRAAILVQLSLCFFGAPSY